MRRIQKCKLEENVVMHCLLSSLVTFVIIVKLIFPDELLELVIDLNEVNYEIHDKFSTVQVYLYAQCIESTVAMEFGKKRLCLKLKYLHS